MSVPTPLSALETARGDSRASQSTLGKLGLVIPTLCEAENIQILLERIQKSLEPLKISYELIVVDDDSRDGIEELVQQIAAKDERVRLLVRTGVRGLAGAVIHGWDNTDADVLGGQRPIPQKPPEPFTQP